MKQLFFLVPYFLAYKYVGIFVLNYLTSAIVPLPGAAILLMVGSLSHRGYCNLFVSYPIALLATVLGDLTAYLFMRLFGSAQRLARYRARSRAFRLVERYVNVHPFATIFISRFVSFSTTAANVIAGLIEMPLKTFLISDCVSNSLCVGLYMGLGYTVGRIWSHASLISLSGIVILISAVLYVLVMIPIYVFHDRSSAELKNSQP